ncbi:isochorismatase hydrolase [Burkholderiales bacterium GJ-E10]|nr:isochorismatase hydrolase [Burkholderiales bacterium GJ-E10]
MSVAPRRALIVIDVQNEYVTGNLRIGYPPVQEALNRIGEAMYAAREIGIPVIVVRHNAPETSPLFAQGSSNWELHAVVASWPQDHRIEKTLPSAFVGTDLDAWLRQREIDTLTVAGFMTHNCCASTIIDAMHRGYAVEFLSDAAGSVPYRNEAGAASAETIHRTFLVVFQARFAAVARTPGWVDAIQNGKPLVGSNIHSSHQAALT